MERWYLLLGAHDHIWRDQKWPPEVRVATWTLLREKMLQLEDIKPLPPTPPFISPFILPNLLIERKDSIDFRPAILNPLGKLSSASKA